MSELSEKEFLEKYDSSIYEKPSVTVDTLLFTILNEKADNYRKLDEKKLSILLVKRKGHPFKDKWAIPGGFVGINESLDDACKRELKEETNVDNIYLEQLYTYGDVDRDPRMRVISSAYLALIDSSKLKVKAGDDASDARWFSIDYKLVSQTKNNEENKIIKVYKLILKHEDIVLNNEVEYTYFYKNKNVEKSMKIIKSEVAFDHAKIISYGIERLRNKIEYTDIAFNLMEEYFTLSELQQVYEIILGKELLKANFRRKINPYVVETNNYSDKKGGYRPSKLFKYSFESLERGEY